MKWPLRLYPAWWRDRYGAEMAALLDDLPHRRRPAVFLDLLRGALDARFALAKESAMPSLPALRPSLLLALATWVVLSVEIFLTNVVFPSTGDDDTVDVLLSYLGVFVVLAVVGYEAARRGTSMRGIILCGAAAGAVIGLLTAGTFFLVDNIWLDVVARQPQKITGLAESGGGSMRAYINQGLIGAAVFLTVVLGIFGTGLAAVGATIAQWRSSRSALGA